MTMDKDDMLSQLEKYWDTQGIAALSFSCKYSTKNPLWKSCNLGTGNFATAKEAYIGSEYEKGTLPRVLFISADRAAATNPKGGADKRTWQYIRTLEETIFDHRVMNPHWRETHEIAFKILEGTARQLGKPLPGPRDGICKYFAHINSAKCKNTKLGTEEAPAYIFKNCKIYIPQEVRLLRPDVIITQGDFAYKSIQNCFNPKIIYHRRNHDMWYEELNIDGRKVLKFKTYHPANWGLYNNQKRNVFPWYYNKVVQRFC